MFYWIVFFAKNVILDLKLAPADIHYKMDDNVIEAMILQKISPCVKVNTSS